MTGCSSSFLRTLMGCAVLLPILTVEAQAHGGQFRRPADRVPVTGGPAPGAGPTTSGAAKAFHDRWEVWWLYNREPYLPRHTLGGAVAPSQGGGFLVGRSGRHGGDRDLLGTMAGRIVDALVEATDDESQDVVDASLIAMARVAREAQEGTVRPVLRDQLSHDVRAVREAALLALGILGHEDDLPRLIEVLGGEAPQGGEATTQDRALAALALGLLDRPGASAALRSQALQPGTPMDLSGACILGLGLLERDARRAVVDLQALWNNPTLERAVRAQIPVAVQRLPRSVGRTQLSWIVKALKARDVPAELERSLVLALGNLADVEDPELVALVRDRARKATDRVTRHFSLIALARIYEGTFADAASPAEVEAAQREFPEVAKLLQDALGNRARRSEQAFAALAAGLILRAAPADVLKDHGVVLRRTLRRAFERERDPSQRGAYAIALGLGEVTEAVDELRDGWNDTRDFGLQGHVAIALGLLDDQPSAAAFRARLTDEGLTTALRVELTRALGMMRDDSTLTNLVGMLAASSNLSEAAAAAVGLALVADARASGPVLRILGDDKAPDARRAFAAVALGILAERDSTPWNLPLSIDANYTVPNRAWSEVLSIL